MTKRLFILMILAVALVSVSLVSAQDTVALGPITQAIVDRGELICGVNGTLPGFGVVNDAGEYSGFDVDICRAVAAAILGDATKVSFRPLTGAERQAAIQGGEIDMMSRNTTWTLSRDTTWGVTFGPTTFYDGQGIGTRVALGVSTIEELDGASICVQSGTTTELNITDAITSRGLDINILTFPDGPTTFQAYLDGRCEAAGVPEVQGRRRMAAAKPGRRIKAVSSPTMPVRPIPASIWFWILRSARNRSARCRRSRTRSLPTSSPGRCTVC